MDLLKELTDKLDQMCNDQFDSAEFKQLLELPLTMKRAQFYIIQNALYTSNRRDCWAYAQGGAPLEVKRSIWQHESDELINDPRAITDHYTLTVRQGEHLGLTPRDFENGEVPRWCAPASAPQRGPWWNSGASHMNQALPKSYFDRSGLVSLLDTARRLQFVFNEPTDVEPNAR